MHGESFFSHKIFTALLALKGKGNSVLYEHVLVQIALITQTLEADVAPPHRLLGVHGSYVLGE